jgi:tetratricopeptide (TPR) repeat protein
MTHSFAVRFITLAAVTVLLAACAGVPPGGPQGTSGAGTGSRNDPVADFELRQREQAVTLERQGKWGEAAQAWEVLAVLRPAEYRERLAEARRQADVLATERLQRARAELKKGDLDSAEQSYLGVLALQPEQAEAADGLRGIERARNKRDYLGQPSRLTLTRKPGARIAPSEQSIELEHAAMLAGQGEYDEAIGMLQKRVDASPRDAAPRRALADTLLKKAQALQASDPKAAREALQRCLKLEPKNVAAAALLKKLPAG